MAVYRASIDHAFAHGSYRREFFDTLTRCLETICREGSIVMVDLAPPINPKQDAALVGGLQYATYTIYERDVLLLRDGAPLLAVFLRYRCSSGLKNILGEEDAGYVTAPSYQGATSFMEVQQSLGERLRTSVPAPAPEDPPKPSFNEGQWTMALRALDIDRAMIFQGSPLDVGAIDNAFTVMVDQIVAHIPKPAVQPVAK